MSTKINYSSQKVRVSAELSFSEMGSLQDALTLAALEAIDRDEDKTLDDILTAAEKLGIDLDLDLEVKAEEFEPLSKMVAHDTAASDTPIINDLDDLPNVLESQGIDGDDEKEDLETPPTPPQVDCEHSEEVAT